MKHLIYIVIVFNSIFVSYSQNNWRKSIPISFDLGLHSQSTTIDSITIWNSKPFGNSLQLQSGISVLYKQRVGVLAQAGIGFHNQNYTSSKAKFSYFISTIMYSVNCTPYAILFELPNEGSLHLGCGIGYSYGTEDMIVKNKSGYTFTSNTYKVFAPTFAPEIGITLVEDKVISSIAVTYYYQSGVNMISKTSISDNSGSYSAIINGNYLGLKLRYQFKIGKDKVHPKNIKRNKVYPNIYKPEPPENDVYIKRTNTIIRNYKTRKDHVTLEFFENNKVDHDSISVCINGKYILVNHGLTKEKVSIQVPLTKGSNSINIYALNEGDIPPNTATCIIHFGKRKEEFPVQTGSKKNASIVINKK